MNRRMSSVAGSFYPADSASVLEMIERFNRILEQHPDALHKLDPLEGKAVIVPHAGWIYSGFTANIAHRIMARRRPKTIVVIGPSHRVGFEGTSIADTDTYQTPLGDLAIDRELTRQLQERFALPYRPQAHHEHSTEVQMPFIKHYLPDVRIVELVYAYAEPKDLEPVIDYLLGLEGIGIVISTDLSHYYSLEKANRLDAICLEAIRSESTDLLHQGCEACGAIGVEAMIGSAKKNGLESVLLDYRTSADASGDSSQVVGYASALFR